MEFEPKIAFFKTASIYGVSSKKKTAKRREFVAAPEIAQ